METSKINLIYRLGIYNLQTRTLTLQYQEKLPEKVDGGQTKDLTLKDLTLKTKKVNTKSHQMKHCPCPKYCKI